LAAGRTQHHLLLLSANIVRGISRGTGFAGYLMPLDVGGSLACLSVCPLIVCRDINYGLVVNMMTGAFSARYSDDVRSRRRDNLSLRWTQTISPQVAPSFAIAGPVTLFAGKTFPLVRRACPAGFVYPGEHARALYLLHRLSRHCTSFHRCTRTPQEHCRARTQSPPPHFTPHRFARSARRSWITRLAVYQPPHFSAGIPSRRRDYRATRLLRRCGMVVLDATQPHYGTFLACRHRGWCSWRRTLRYLLWVHTMVNFSCRMNSRVAAFQLVKHLGRIPITSDFSAPHAR